MRIVCLDLEGVLVPEIWIAFADATGIPELRRTTRDEPDYDKLMRFRLDLLREKGLKLGDIQRVIGTMEPLEGAKAFANAVREKTQLIILSDTFEQFAKPLMAKLGYPTLFCNSLTAEADGTVSGYTLRQKDGKKHAVLAFKSINMEIFAAGDSFNDLSMIQEADRGCLFRAPDSIRAQCGDIPWEDSYTGLLNRIDDFLNQ
ncbi:bifunctional phosphoserine phosphatase/homoserine phosphotransferase ThrH [Breznakiella homolactica]|uniref:phosphoserine phosphatase n=1 Tax=Breznakiella homolactica TaxID=2798577 RepID=A0A7T8B924_9SPIR|nr:bifunctional phosphoserine phosphatase/homoserine phosphotransferase ThrH [Breznakiella homolactica]QQO09199.1 bifunctional phosphoserine phosphatase/homoserine phosphotransferase ThrH [Breznakiella homolactica]